MHRFIVVADLRTGSTLLQTSLDRHPRIRCYGELFHPRDLPDNRVPGIDRREHSGAELMRHAFGSVDDADAVGFRAMIFLPLDSDRQWSDAWEALAAIDDLRVVYLIRRNRLAQYASAQIAHRTGAYHPRPDHPVLEPDSRPTITIEPDAFQRWLHERDELLHRRRRRLDGKPALDVAYEDLTGAWSRTLAAVQDFLGVEPRGLEPAKRKQERRPLSDVIENYEDLMNA